MSEEFTTPDISAAWDRIARTADGQVVYRHLQKLLMALSNDLSALPVHEGGRILARHLMSLMAQGIADSDRYAIAFPIRPANVSGADSGTDARRKWLASQPSWYDDPGPGTAGGGGTSSNGSGGTGTTS